MKILPKIVLILFSLFFLVFLPSSVFAESAQDVFYRDTQQLNQMKKEANTCGQNGTPCVNALDTVNFNLDATLFQITNKIGCTDPTSCNDKATALGTMSRAIASLYEVPPASGVAFMRDTLSHAGIIQPAYAQGIGTVGLSSYLPFWKVARNIAYSVIVIVMIAIGFMIVFRMKMDPKTVITVQAALPKIVVSLLLVTFSYPIAGFLIDIMYVVMAILIKLMVDGMGGSQAGFSALNLQSTYLNAGINDLFGAVFWAGIFNNPGTTGGSAGATVGMTFIAGLLTKVITLAPLAVSGWAPILSLGGLILLFIFGGFLFTFVRLFFLLLNSYIQLVITVIFGPLVLLTEAIPGRSAFGNYVSNILANLVVFPATAAVLIFAAFLGAQGQNGQMYWTPPFIGLGGGQGIFHYILSIGVVFLSPGLVASAKKIFNPQPLLPFSIGTIFAPFTGTVQTGMSALQSQYYIQSAQHGPLQGFLSKLGIGGGGQAGGGGGHHQTTR